MSGLKNAMEIYKLLDRSNCGECRESTCLAFAGAVFTGRRELQECPHLPAAVVARYGGAVEKPRNADDDVEDHISELKQRVRKIDLAAAARRLGADYRGGRLGVKILGKDFSVDAAGNLFSDIHIHHWVAIPFLDYVLNGKGQPPSGNWVPLRELPSGEKWHRLFGQRCEAPLKRIADGYTDLFADMVELFNGRRVEKHYAADISLVLHPLPKLPVLICYWKPEDDLESDFHLFFDSTAEDNLRIESIYAIGAGLANMFEKLSMRHGLR